MATFKFIGEYAEGHDGVTLNGATFVGHEPSEVPEASIRKFRGHPCFEEVHPLDHDGDGSKGGSLKGEKSTVRRGRKPKA